VQLGAGEAKQKNVAKPQREHFAKAEVPLKRRSPNSAWRTMPCCRSRRTIAASHFVPGQLVDVTGHTQGKGFAGAMKRWGFGGMRATHGVSISHRAHGSTGQPPGSGQGLQEQEDGRPHGRPQRTQQNLEVVRTDDERGLIFVKGSVPGSKNGWLPSGRGEGRSRHAGRRIPGRPQAPNPANSNVRP
jgi:large subunit ribosomal protein L3